MALLQLICGTLLSAQFAHLTSSLEFLCQDENCYSIAWTRRSFSRASSACNQIQGHLMTVKTPEQLDAIHLLMANVESDYAAVWIGLQQPDKDKCTDPLQPLRGFTWVTGDSYTDYSNWRTDEQKCGALCVTVRKDGTWGEADCTQKADGYLCEINYSTSCKPLKGEVYNVTYYHEQLGFPNILGSDFPPGTHALISTSTLFCEDSKDRTGTWSSNTPGAWTCLIENGGCEYECVNISGTPECKCPPGSQLKEDKRACSKPCDPNPCSQLCVQIPEPPGFSCMCSEGYSITEDGVTCEDIDDCAVNPNLCEQHCINTIGSFVCDCIPGFEMVDDKCQDIDECLSVMCEQHCENHPRGYMCSCDEGFVIDENNPMKCKRFCNTSVCEAECDAKLRHLCHCPDGYILEESEAGDPICTAIPPDECEENPCVVCITTTIGSYQCTCPEGYVVQNDACIPDKGGNEVEEPSEVRPSHTFDLQPSILLGIFIAVISMLAVLIAFLCLMVRRHYREKHSMDHKYKNFDNTVVLKYVKMDPWETL